MSRQTPSPEFPLPPPFDGDHDHHPGETTHVDLDTGLLNNVRYVPSPNRDARPPGVEPELVVLHGISLPPGEFGGPWIDRLFTNTLPADEHPFFDEIDELHVSAHLLVRRDGEVVQYVPFHERAWHAGVSSWHGREDVNDFSIGIEVEGSPLAPYSGPQYVAINRVLDALEDTYPEISRTRMVGHTDVAPERKQDPWDTFDWDQVRPRRA
jgi:AmpD protein